MQVFRLMGMPDKVIAFDELPARFLEGLEISRPDGLPRDWKRWLPSIKKVIALLPERDPYTGQMRRFEPVTEDGPGFYLVDETLNHDYERWQEISNFVKQSAPRDFRLLDKLEDMAKPMADDIRSEMKLETEAVLVIPILPEYQEKQPQGLVDPKGVELPKTVPAVKERLTLKCEDCEKEFSGEPVSARSALRMHRMKKHPAPEPVKA